MRPVQAVKKNRRLRQPVIVPLQRRRGSTMIGRIVTVHARYAVYLLMLSLSVLLAALYGHRLRLVPAGRYRHAPGVCRVIADRGADRGGGGI